MKNLPYKDQSVRGLAILFETTTDSEVRVGIITELFNRAILLENIQDYFLPDCPKRERYDTRGKYKPLEELIQQLESISDHINEEMIRSFTREHLFSYDELKDDIKNEVTTTNK